MSAPRAAKSLAVPADVPLDLDGEGRLFFQLKVAQATSKSVLDAAFAELGITTTLFLTLAAIARNGTASSAEIARQTFVSPQAMMVNVRRLESAGLIRRSPASQGGRSLDMALTPPGHELLVRGKERAVQIETYVREHLGEACLTQLVGDMAKLTDCLANSVRTTTSRAWELDAQETRG